jgi:glycosyltransferase involved in cell wall biosynthesis
MKPWKKTSKDTLTPWQKNRPRCTHVPHCGRLRSPAHAAFRGCSVLSDIFVFASDTETFGNVVLEAAASGLPLVVVDRGGVRETAIPGRTGVRVPPGDAEMFARACIELLDDDGRRARLAHGARAEAMSRRWPDILDGVLEAYEEAAPTGKLEGAIS